MSESEIKPEPTSVSWLLLLSASEDDDDEDAAEGDAEGDAEEDADEAEEEEDVGTEKLGAKGEGGGPTALTQKSSFSSATNEGSPSVVCRIGTSRAPHEATSGKEDAVAAAAPPSAPPPPRAVDAEADVARRAPALSLPLLPSLPALAPAAATALLLPRPLPPLLPLLLVRRSVERGWSEPRRTGAVRLPRDFSASSAPWKDRNRCWLA